MCPSLASGGCGDAVWVEMVVSVNFKNFYHPPLLRAVSSTQPPAFAIMKSVSALTFLASVAFAADPCHTSHLDQASCDKDTTTGGGCTWCKCAALPSSCWTTANSKKLPQAVYTCDNSNTPAPILGDADIKFEHYLRVHNKMYSKSELDMRRATFERTRQSVVSQNKLYHSGKSTWWAAINKFADLYVLVCLLYLLLLSNFFLLCFLSRQKFRG